MNLMRQYNSSCWIYFSVVDLADIKLINAEDEMKELQEKVHEYQDKHKNNMFHDIQDAQEKLVLRLDSIEVSGSQDYQKRRSKLYTDNQKLSNELTAKFKDHPSDCKDCVQVKVVEVRLDK